MQEIFKRLGYEAAFRYEKYRSEYSHPSASAGHVVIDETPIGNFAELEGPMGWIDQTLVALRVDPATCLTESYGRLFTAWKERTSSPAENLTFDEAGVPSLASR
jgi:adenylate cyclase class 2